MSINNKHLQEEKELDKSKKFKDALDAKKRKEGLVEKDEDEDEDEEDEEDDDEEDDDEDDKKDVVEKKYKKNIKESLSSIFEGETLTETFKSKASTIIEAMIIEKTNELEEAAILYVESINEELTQKSIDYKDYVVQELSEKTDKYIDYVVENWMAENAVAIETGLKVEMAESLINGMKTLFTENNITVSEDKADLYESVQSEVSVLKERLDTLINENIELKKNKTDLENNNIFESLSKDLTEIDRERLRLISEDISFDNKEEYTEKLKTLKESFLNRGITTLNEDTEITNKKYTLSDNMSKYVQAINKFKINN